MKKVIKICLLSAITAYILKFIVDVVMYIFMINEQSDIYYDFWFLFVPQVTSSVMMVVFYLMFLSNKFYGMFFKISTVVLIIFNILFIALLYFDSTIEYIYYFALVASINFLNSLYLKCNITPTRKPGGMEYMPMLFELIPFVGMVLSLYAVFCAFPTLEVTPVSEVLDYYDITTAIKLNIVSEGVLIFAYILCTMNRAEIIRDNMFDENEVK